MLCFQIIFLDSSDAHVFRRINKVFGCEAKASKPPQIRLLLHLNSVIGA